MSANFFYFFLLNFYIWCSITAVLHSSPFTFHLRTFLFYFAFYNILVSLFSPLNCLCVGKKASQIKLSAKDILQIMTRDVIKTDLYWWQKICDCQFLQSPDPSQTSPEVSGFRWTHLVSRSLFKSPKLTKTVPQYGYKIKTLNLVQYMPVHLHFLTQSQTKPC